MVGYDAARGREAHRGALERVRSVAGVEAASFSSTVPFGEFHEGMPVAPVGAPTAGEPGSPTQTVGGRQQRSPTYRIVGADYFRALGLRMMRGREFTPAEEQSASAPRVAIVDELLARQLFPDRDPLGELIKIERMGRESGSSNDGEPMEIVGIAPPMRDTLFDKTAVPHIYVPFGRHYRASMTLHVRVREAGVIAENAVLEGVRRGLAQFDAQLPLLDLLPMRRFHDRSLELWAVRAGGNVVISLGGLALLLALVGVYGVKSYVVSQRIREFGIRVAVGARPSDVLWLVLGEGMALTVTGLAIGLPLAALAGFGLSRLLYEVSPLDPFVFITAPLALALSATFASWVPAWRATRIAPTTALRAE
jgi:hypothetical protein